MVWREGRAAGGCLVLDEDMYKYIHIILDLRRTTKQPNINLLNSLAILSAASSASKRVSSNLRSGITN